GLPSGLRGDSPRAAEGVADAVAVAVLTAAPTAPATTAEVAVVAESGPDLVAESRLRVEIRPARAAVAYRRGQAQFASGAYHRAVADFGEVIRLDPEHVWAYC